MRRSLAALGLGLALVASPLAAEPRHGLSAFGDLKYPATFTHFDYVNPQAPKGGDQRAMSFSTFDSFHPAILRGNPAPSISLLFASLMTRALDEPDAMYGYIAESADVAPDHSSVTFALRPTARWHDGTPITADDVVFTLEAIRRDGHPQYRLALTDVSGIEADGPLKVTVRFKPGPASRDLPLTVASLPILQKKWFEGREFTKPTLEPPTGSGPYKVESADPGRNLTYARVRDWWGEKLPVAVGRFNPDRMRWVYFRDREIAVEGFFAGEYDVRLELTARVWATGYDKPPVEKGYIKREVLPDGNPAGFQAFYFNTRRAKFADPKVREALALSFDFEWTNKTLFYGLYKRLRSRFDNSPLAATGLPSPAELALLEPFRAELDPRVFTEEFNPPRTDGSGEMRDNLRRAGQLLTAAGWVVKDGRRVNARTGEALSLEFLEFEPSFDRILGPYFRNLERLGIKAEMRVVDPAAFENRIRDFDFDATSRGYSQGPTPGIELKNFFGAAAADVTGSLNIPGIRSKAVDALVEKALAATTREELTVAIRALDRVLMWGNYWIPSWYSGTHRLAYWDRLSRPDPIAPYSDYNPEWEDYWWYDEAKSARLPKVR